MKPPPDSLQPNSLPPSPRLLAYTLLALFALASLLLLFLFDPSTHAFYPPCPLHALTGLDCPTCGGLRAAHLLLHGHLRAAFHSTGATYLAACAGDPELVQMAERAPDGLAARLIDGVRPPWLSEIASGPAGMVFSVRPSGLDVTGSLPVLRLRPSIRE